MYVCGLLLCGVCDSVVVGLDFGGCVLLLFDFALLISFVVYLRCCLVWVFMAAGYFVVLFICDLGFVGGL